MYDAGLAGWLGFYWMRGFTSYIFFAVFLLYLLGEVGSLRFLIFLHQSLVFFDFPFVFCLFQVYSQLDYSLA